MLRLLSLATQGLLVALAGYNAVTALWGWRNRVPAPARQPSRRLRVVVPAHDEEQVIGGLLADLAAADYPAASTSVFVIADRCSDGTAAVAVAHGVSVAERSSGMPGKGAALQWFLAENPLAEDEALVVFDADNRVPANVLRRIADELEAGNDVVQCYLDVTNPDASALTMASALSYWAGNRMVQLARDNLGWSADLGGTGMAFTRAALDAVGGVRDTLTEDQDLSVRLALADVRVAWLHDVRIRDEKPAELSSFVGQRARWMAGKRAAARSHARRLFATALQRRSLRLFDQGLRLVQPGRSFVALVSGVLTAASAVTRSPWLLPAWLWGTVTAIQVLLPIPFLARDEVPKRYIVRYPMLAVLAALWIPMRVLSRTVRSWSRTPHVGTLSSERNDPGGRGPATG